MEQDLKYAQQLINVLQKKLNESTALNVQLEAKQLMLEEEVKVQAEAATTYKAASAEEEEKTSNQVQTLQSEVMRLTELSTKLKQEARAKTTAFSAVKAAKAELIKEKEEKVKAKASKKASKKKVPASVPSFTESTFVLTK